MAKSATPALAFAPYTWTLPSLGRLAAQHSSQGGRSACFTAILSTCSDSSTPVEIVMAATLGRRKVHSKRRNDPEGLRARILDQAAKLFQERGYHSTSMHDLMQETGVSAGALHVIISRPRITRARRSRGSGAAGGSRSLDRSGAQCAGARKGREGRVWQHYRRDAGAHVRAGLPIEQPGAGARSHRYRVRQAVESIFAEWRTALIERIGETRGGARLGQDGRAAAANFVIAAYSGAMNMAKAAQSPAPLATPLRCSRNGSMNGG